MKIELQPKCIKAPAKPGTPAGEVRVPFEVDTGGAKWPVLVESDGNGGTRYYFHHPTQRTTNEKTKKPRKKKIHSKSKAEITRLLKEAVRDMKEKTVTLPREKFDVLEEAMKRLERLESECKAFGLSVEVFLGQVLPAFADLPANVTPSQVVNEGGAHFVPTNPMTVKEVFDELFPCLQTNTLTKHASNTKCNCAPLLKKHGATPIHLVDTPDPAQNTTRPTILPDLSSAASRTVGASTTLGSNGASTRAGPKSRFKGSWPQLKSVFLEMLWSMPAVKIAKQVGVSNVAVRKRALALNLPYPDRSYRAKMGCKLPVQIPDHIVSLLRQLRDEEQAN